MLTFCLCIHLPTILGKMLKTVNLTLTVTTSMTVVDVLYLRRDQSNGRYTTHDARVTSVVRRPIQHSPIAWSLSRGKQYLCLCKVQRRQERLTSRDLR